jgi:hypothetical protein
MDKFHETIHLCCLIIKEIEFEYEYEILWHDKYIIVI